MKSNINITPLKTWSSIPSVWESRPNTINYNQLPESELYADGWRDLVIPSYDSNTQKLGTIQYDDVNHIVTYPVIDKIVEEIEAEQKALVPFSITSTQGIILLHRMSLLDQVETMVANSDDIELIIYWKNAITWERDNSYINTMGQGLGMDDAEIDQFFISASLIQ